MIKIRQCIFYYLIVLQNHKPSGKQMLHNLLKSGMHIYVLFRHVLNVPIDNLSSFLSLQQLLNNISERFQLHASHHYNIHLPNIPQVLSSVDFLFVENTYNQLILSCQIPISHNSLFSLAIVADTTLRIDIYQ